jgi:hypothetical protein
LLNASLRLARGKRSKAKLETAAQRTKQSLAGLLDRIAREWLEAAGSEGAEAAEQKRLHDHAAKSIGVLHGADRTAPSMHGGPSARV